MIEIDAAQKRLSLIQQDLLRALEAQPNEADTRLQVIDRLLMEVIGWSPDAISCEKSADGGYIDYTLTALDGRPAFVIEAKRVGKLNVGSLARGVSPLSLSGSVLSPLIPTIKQALSYASWQSVPVACITDGSAWLFFQTNRRDGKPVIEGKGIFFPAFSAVIAEFPKFHDLISPLGVRDRLNILQLNRAEGIRAAAAEDQIFVSPPDQAKMLSRDSLSKDASLLFKQFFSRISSDTDPDMLRLCFVETAESKKADAEIQKIAQKLINGIEAIETGSGAALQAEVERAISVMSSESVLLIGNKGAGKSTFLTRFFSDVLPPAIRKQCVVVRIPLDEFTGEEGQLIPWAVRRLRDQLEKLVCSSKTPTYEELQGVFWSEYTRQRDGALKHLYEKDKGEFKISFGRYLEDMRANQPETYAKFFLERAVYSDRRLPCIIFDNADQFSSATQDAVFQLAHSLGATAPVLNIVPITDRTVWRLSKVGALQSYPSKSFYLPVPEAKAILAKRIDYIKLKLGAGEDLAKTYFSSRGFRVTLDSIEKFAQAVERVFIGNDFVSGLMGRLANFDIRRMLRIAERIFLSPEIRIDEVLKTSYGYAPGRAETMRIHRAIIKGELDRYSDRENEYVANLFWTDPEGPSSPLLAFYVLWLLRQRIGGAKSDDVDARHLTVAEVCAYFEVTGVWPDQTMVILQRLRDRGLIEGLDPTIEVLSSGHSIAITDCGIAHIELTGQSPVYMEQMALATGLNNRATYEEIRRLRNAATSESFGEIKRVFADYLIQVDAIRVSIPNAREYAGLAEARKVIRGLGHLAAARETESQSARTPRATPMPSVGGFVGKRRR